MQRDAAEKAESGSGRREGRKQAKEERKDLFWREIKQQCGEMEAPTIQPQSRDLLKAVIKVMEGPKTLTIRKTGGGGGVKRRCGVREDLSSFLPSLCFFFLFLPACTYRGQILPLVPPPHSPTRSPTLGPFLA